MLSSFDVILLYYIICVLYYNCNNLMYFLIDDTMTYLCTLILIIYCLSLFFGLYYFIVLTHSFLTYLSADEDSL